MHAPSWSQPFPLPSGAAAALSLGPLRLHVCHLDGEWQLRSRWEADQIAEPQLDVEAPAFDPSTSARRFGFSAPPERARFAPALADRPVIIRPEEPFTLLPGESVRAYVSTPLWVQVFALGQRPRLLCELPSQRPSDTWFGPSPREGVLCYASSTRLRLRVAGAPPAANRAITPVVLENAWTDPMELARVRLPVRHLSLFTGAEGRLWTERVTLRRAGSEMEEEVVIDGEPPREAAAGAPVAGPREARDRSFTLQVFEPLFRLV